MASRSSTSVNVQLNAQALPPSDIVFTPGVLSFGVVDAGGNVARTFSAQNRGGVNATFTIAFETDAGFGLDAGTCATGFLMPDASCDGVVHFTPSTAGTRTALITFDGGATPALLNVDGTGRLTWLLTLGSDGGTITEASNGSCSSCVLTFEETVLPVNAVLTAAPLDSAFWGSGTWSGDCTGPPRPPAS